MADLESLNFLIESLSKSEKRYFQLYSKLHGSSTAYHSLFSLLVRYPNQIDRIKAQFKKSFPESCIEPISNHLFSVILKSLEAYQRKDFGDEFFQSGIQEITLLLARNIYDVAFKRIENLRYKAIDSEKFVYAVLLTKLEINSKMQFRKDDFTEQELVSLSILLNQLLKKELALNDHAALFQTLELRFSKEGVVRNNIEKEKLNDMVFVEMSLSENPRYSSFEMQKNHLLFQSTYFSMIGSNTSATQTYRELNQLFEQHIHLWEKSPEYYILHLRRFLDVLFSKHQFEEMPFFIEKLHSLVSKTNRLLVFPHIYIAQLSILMGTGKITEAYNYYVDNKELILQKLIQTSLSDRFLILLLSSICLYKSGKLSESSLLLNKQVSLKQPKQNNLLNFRMCRLFNLVIQLELDNTSFLASEMRSLERELKAKSKLFLTEQAVLIFIKRILLGIEKSEKLLDNKLVNILSQMRQDPYEMKILQLFNFADWIEGKASVLFIR
jgi:hypothetical protein